MDMQDEKIEPRFVFPDEGFAKLSQLILPLWTAAFLPGRYRDHTHTRLISCLWLFLPPYVYFLAYPYIIPFIKQTTTDISLFVLPFFYLALIVLAAMFSIDLIPGAEEEKQKSIRRAAFNLTVSSFCIPASLIYGVGLLDIGEEDRTLIRIILLAYAVPMAAHAYSRVPWFDPSKSWNNWLKAALLMVILLFPVLKKMLHG